uniref:Cell division control protein 73 C-terminal domain-containing protein n=1 Tax=Panagrolaimus sp. PS1159 TaxID=55785 RepID=A0AC35GNH7_9BILA
MDGGVLAAMHQCIVQGDTFKKVEKDGNLYYKILDTYYPFDTPSNVRTFDNEGFYSVGTVGTFYLNHENQSAYTRNALELNVELVPRAHQKAIALYIQKGVINPDLVLADAPTISITSTEFEENDTAIEEIDKTSLNQSTTDENGRQMDASATSVRDLNPLLTAERVAQLASKAKQVRTQKSKTDRGFVLDAEVSDKNLDSIDKYLKYKTRVHKNTTNCMDSSANFSSVLSLISSMKSREHSTTASLPKPPLAPNLQANNAPAKANPSQNNRGYSRYDQEVFHNDEADEFQIQTGMSFHGTSLKKINSLKTAAKPIADPVRQQLKRPYPSSSSNNAAANNKPQKRTSRTPIIIIPASGTALISMYNAMDILQDLKFVSTEEKKRVIQRRENELLIHRRKDNGQTVPYRIVDNPSRLTDEEWDRVVAVFVQGPAWQFKGWHWGGNPTTIFSHVKGFHLKFEDAKLDQNVAKWSVDVLSLSKQKRHLDKSIFIQLWQKIEQHIIRNKPSLRV